MKRIITALIVVGTLAVPATAAADTVYEEGATFFDDYTCVEADGAVGITTFDGQCMTTADYDEIFSYENLSETVSSRPSDNGATIAEIYDIQPDAAPASERPIGVGLVEEPFTFGDVIERIEYAQGLVIRLA